MASNRSPIFRSSSQGEIGVFNQPFALERARFGKKHTAFSPASKTISRPVKPSPAKKEEPRKPIFFIEPLEKEIEGSKKREPDRSYGEFLKACSLCKKKLDQNKDVFMYGFLGAFCSTDCRQKRIDLDGFNEEVAKDLAARMTAVQREILGKGNVLTPLQMKFLCLP